jgi:hypothetical protein
MATKPSRAGSKVTYVKQHNEIIFIVEGMNRNYTISLASAEQTNTVGPDLNELIWSIERAWRNSEN